SDQNGRPLGRLTTAVESVPSFATKLENTAEVGVVIQEGAHVLGASDPELGRAQLPHKGSTDIGGTKYRVRSVNVQGFDGRRLTMRIATPDQTDSGNPTLLVLGALLGFLVLAIAFAITVSRTLQAEVQSLLEAA